MNATDPSRIGSRSGRHLLERARISRLLFRAATLFQAAVAPTAEEMLEKYTTEAANPALSADDAVALVNKRLADRFTEISPVGVISELSREQVAEQIRQSKKKDNKTVVIGVARTNLRVRLSNSVGMVTYNEDITVGQNGSVVVRHTSSFSVLDVWIKLNDEWRQVSSQAAPTLPLDPAVYDIEKKR